MTVARATDNDDTKIIAVTPTSPDPQPRLYR